MGVRLGATIVVVPVSTTPSLTVVAPLLPAADEVPSRVACASRAPLTQAAAKLQDVGTSRAADGAPGASGVAAASAHSFERDNCLGRALDDAQYLTSMAALHTRAFVIV